MLVVSGEQELKTGIVPPFMLYLTKIISLARPLFNPLDPASSYGCNLNHRLPSVNYDLATINFRRREKNARQLQICFHSIEYEYNWQEYDEDEEYDNEVNLRPLRILRATFLF